MWKGRREKEEGVEGGGGKGEGRGKGGGGGGRW